MHYKAMTEGYCHIGQSYHSDKCSLIVVAASKLFRTALHIHGLRSEKLLLRGPLEALTLK